MTSYPYHIVILTVVLSNVILISPPRRYVAGPGDNATNEIVRGRQGEDSVVEVPPGTVATDIKTGETVCDVDQENTRYLLQVCRGNTRAIFIALFELVNSLHNTWYFTSRFPKILLGVVHT